MREYGTVIRQQGEKLQFLLDSLVKISRLENGIIQTVPQKGELGELACQVKSLMEQKATEKQIFLEVKPGKEKAYAWFDRKWTREALMNLVDNAVKYTPLGGKVTLEAFSYSLFSRIDVRDTGIGIEEEELPEIFHRFYRSRDVLSEEGVGLRKGREVSFPYFFPVKKEKMSPDCDISETVWRFFPAILSLKKSGPLGLSRIPGKRRHYENTGSKRSEKNIRKGRDSGESPGRGQLLCGERRISGSGGNQRQRKVHPSPFSI